MELTVVFESWLVPDGKYPPLVVGDEIRIALEVAPSALETADASVPLGYQSCGDGEYTLCACVLRVYHGDFGSSAAFDAGGLRFYVTNFTGKFLREGEHVQITGTLLVDQYAWSEDVGTAPDAPDLFHNFRVRRIRQVRLPERFVARHARGKTHPARLGPADYGPEDVYEVDSMVGASFDEEFYLLDLDARGLETKSLPPTFRR
jgi:hypothetical protein